MKSLSLFLVALFLLSLTTGCPDHSKKRTAPDYSDMVDQGEEFSELDQ